ncbi:energy transducer TonB [Pseudoxanthomonas kalamensis DSM 18571]|uniref:energy transducer TonB n=1 Tax=Pseudoxanthomonas kalamensis TaxID=289483 RepID=UPI0013915AAE|nr:energy transducer TonB [Pseudoxanthomonas kalamensis]KAF1710362.1 energy transducer TonB [Pseudoxanthomonas kalamensis DSM 18571]
MVRTLRTPSLQLDTGRILALAGAITVHLLALLLLLVPMTATTPPVAQIVEETIWIRAIKPEQPPLPPEIIKHAKTTPKPQTQPKVPVQIDVPVVNAPVIVDNGSLAADMPIETTGPVTDVAPVSTGPVEVGQLGYVRATAPSYPAAEARRGIQGTVLLRVLVDVDGRPLQVNIERSSGNRNLDRSALQHVKASWLFQPAVRDGHPVQAWGLVPISFTLQ